MNIGLFLKNIAALFLIYFFACAFAFAVDRPAENRVVAEVNGVAITQQELDIATNRLLPKTFYHSSISPEKRKEAEKKAIEDLINRELFFQEAKRLGLTAKNSEVKEHLNIIEKQYPSQEAFKEALQKYGINIETLEKKIKKDILIKKLMEKEIKVNLTDEEVEEYYNKNFQKFKKPESIRLRYILIKFRPTEPDFRKKAKAKAEEVLSKLDSGKDFAEMAWSYSDDRSRVKGGDIGYIHKGRFTPEIENVAFSLRKGEVSDLIENDYGYHIVKVEDKKPSRQIPFLEIKEKLKAELTSSYQAEKKEKLIKRLRENAAIKYY